ncbi:MAG TPA: aspartate carbamoyltransferase [Candidatus Solibacter sp.]|jgi:aspartate carbamoyltransferase catalytic subunit|nr:aspartate carbamoyltransferase [Candidatus Solibacter sp.]
MPTAARHRTELRHVVESQQFDRPLLDHVFSVASAMELVAASGGSDELKGRIMASLFYEPSTRTRLSFEAAMLRLGGEALGTESAGEFSSVAKGETLEDTVKIVSAYCDVIVLRHFDVGASKRAAAVSPVPVINAGDGPGQHPTQALLDLYTINKELGRVDGLRIAMVGDLANGRTVRSLSYLLSKYDGVELVFVAPPAVAMGRDIKAHLEERGVAYTETEDLESVLPEVDVVYQTRIQKERFGSRLAEYRRVSGIYVMDVRTMALMRPDAVLMHPLPRVGEISPEVDRDPRAAYFRQAQNGLYIRMALLSMLLGSGKP